MSHVSLNFEDTEDGGIAFRAHYLDGHTPTSNAHRLAGQVIKWLDEQALKKDQIEIDCEDDESTVIH